MPHVPLSDMFGQELQRLVQHVHEKFVELEKATASMDALGASRVSAAGGQAAGGQDGSDPWAAAAAARGSHPPVAIPPGAPPPGMGPEAAKKYRVELRNWGDHKRCDLDVKPEGFVAWRDRALGFLAGDWPDVRRLLLWAEQQPPTIDRAGEQKGAAEAGFLKHDDVQHVSYVIFEAAKTIMTDSLLSRA